MFYTLSKLFWLFAAPSHVLVLLTVYSLLGLTWRKAHRLWQVDAKRTGWALIIVYIILLTLPVGDWAIFPLEAKAPPALKLPAHIDGVVILGGALDENITAYHGLVAMNGQAERIVYTVPLIRRYPNAKIIYAGGSPYGNDQTEADLAKVLFQMWNINTQNFVFERQSRNTYENLKNSQDLVKPGLNENWLLVTSAAHMSRALQVAQKLHWEMIPYPVDYVSGGWTGLSGGNLRYNLDRLDKAAQEYIGIIAYRITGRA